LDELPIAAREVYISASCLINRLIEFLGHIGAVFWDVAPCSRVALTDVSDIVLTAGIIVMIMVTVRNSETSVSFYQTARRNIPEGSHLYTCLRENLKSHLIHSKLRTVMK
jgi:hypothetical protein